jgi:ribosomal protein S18 acetylase RimI-like enzyme
MTIRQATPEDLETVRGLWEAFYTEWPEPEHRQKDWNDISEDVERLLDTGVALLAEEEGDPVGFALGWPRNERVGYLSDLYVRPEFRRTGIGRALLVQAAAGLGREFLVLTTETRNAPARAYYEGLGFHEESVNFVIRSEALT